MTLGYTGVAEIVVFAIAIAGAAAIAFNRALSRPWYVFALMVPIWLFRALASPLVDLEAAVFFAALASPFGRDIPLSAAARRFDQLCWVVALLYLVAAVFEGLGSRRIASALEWTGMASILVMMLLWVERVRQK